MLALALVDTDDHHDGRAIGRRVAKAGFNPIGLHGSGWRCASDHTNHIVRILFF